MPFIPKPEDLPRPPQYIADLLISLYFDKLHYTFPVLFRPHFMRRYRKLLAAGRDCSSPKHSRFLMVFFAVCACSSSLLPPNTGSELPGIDYYQKALLISHATTGEAPLERVQCLALLSMCSAGWNTLSQSWNLAGQAVRAAQDMGLHRSSRSVGFLCWCIFFKSLTTGRCYLWCQSSRKTEMLSSFDFKSLVVSGGVYILLTGRSLDN